MEARHAGPTDCVFFISLVVGWKFDKRNAD